MIYALLRLRVAVFVVEQDRPYQELDGRDLDRLTRHYWLAPPGAIEDPQATLRLLEPGGGPFRVGRGCAGPPGRGRGGVGAVVAGAGRAAAHGDCGIGLPVRLRPAVSGSALSRRSARRGTRTRRAPGETG